jgi:hypothetical protein
MMKLKLTNNAETTLAGAINETSTTVLLSPGTGILFAQLNAGEFFPLTLLKVSNDVVTREIVYVTARNTDSCTVLRAQEGTTATTFSAGDYAGCHPTAGCFNGKADLEGADFTGAVSAPSMSVAGQSNLTNVAITGPVSMGDNLLKSPVLQDYAYAFKDAVATNTLDYRDGSAQRWAPATGAQTLAITNWPTTNTFGELLIEGVNLGAATITGPSVKWLKSDGTFTTSTSFNVNHGAALQASGIDFILLWTRDGGATIYGKVLR